MLEAKKARLEVLPTLKEFSEPSCKTGVQPNGDAAQFQLRFRFGAVPPPAEVAALRKEARSILVRLAVRLSIDQHDVKKLAA
jgi:hypothetical protein